MKQYLDFSDERNRTGCAYCGASATTVDHIPARAFLDKPYPSNLYTVKACEECNNSSSKDEEYLAFILRYLRLVEEEKLEDLDEYINSVRRRKNEDRLFEALRVNEFNELYLHIDSSAINRILKKYAEAHVCYELSERLPDMPLHIAYTFKNELNSDMLEKYRVVNKCTIYPEIGSRLFQRILETGNNDWIVVQPERYRYLVIYEPDITVRIIINEILCGEVSLLS